MRKLLIFILIGLFLTACSESRTYSGVLKRTDTDEQGNVKITVTKKSETEGVMYVEDTNKTPGLFIRDCTYGISIEKSKADESWYPKTCGIKRELAEEIFGFTGDVNFSDGKIKMKFTAGSTAGNGGTFEFEGTEK